MLESLHTVEVISCLERVWEEFSESGGYPGQPSGPGAYPGAGPTGVPAGPLTVPCNLAFPGGVMPLMLIAILGTVKPNANRLALDLKRE